MKASSLVMSGEWGLWCVTLRLEDVGRKDNEKKNNRLQTNMLFSMSPTETGFAKSQPRFREKMQSVFIAPQCMVVVYSLNV